MKTDKQIEELAYEQLEETTLYGVKSAPIGSRAKSYYETEVKGFVSGYKQAQSEKPTLKELCSQNPDLKDEVVELIESYHKKWGMVLGFASTPIQDWVKENI